MYLSSSESGPSSGTAAAAGGRFPLGFGTAFGIADGLSFSLWAIRKGQRHTVTRVSKSMITSRKLDFPR